MSNKEEDELLLTEEEKMKLAEEMLNDLIPFFENTFKNKINELFHGRKMTNLCMLTITNYATSMLVAGNMMTIMKLSPPEDMAEISMMMMNTSQQLIEKVVNEFFLVLKEEEAKKNGA